MHGRRRATAASARAGVLVAIAASCALVGVAWSRSGTAPAVKLGLADFTVSSQVLSVLGLRPRHPKAQMTRKSRKALDELSRLDATMASMDSEQRKVVLRLQKREESLQAGQDLAKCTSAGCRAWTPDEVVRNEEVVRNNYRTSGGSQQPKGVGTFRIGDPILNKNDKSIYRRKCEEDGNCVTDDWRTLGDKWKTDPQHQSDQKHWRNTKQIDRSMDISANDDMMSQLESLVADTERSIQQCKQQFEVVSDEAIDHCEMRAVRHTCYVFESQNSLCDFAAASRQNRFDGTVYFAKSGLPKACRSEERKHLLQLCRPVEKLPGVAISHWPWQVCPAPLSCLAPRFPCLLVAGERPICQVLSGKHSVKK